MQHPVETMRQVDEHRVYRQLLKLEGSALHHRPQRMPVRSPWTDRRRCGGDESEVDEDRSRARRPEGPGNAPGRFARATAQRRSNDGCRAKRRRRAVPLRVLCRHAVVRETGRGRAHPLDLRGRGGRSRTLPICLRARSPPPPRTVHGPGSLRDAAHRHRIWQPWTTGSTPRKGPARSQRSQGGRRPIAWLAAKKSVQQLEARVRLLRVPGALVRMSARGSKPLE